MFYVGYIHIIRINNDHNALAEALKEEVRKRE